MGKKSVEHHATPLVSIGLPTRNRVDLLKVALTSLLNQSYRNIEYIVSDNASTDETERVMREYASHDTRIRYIRQPKDINGMENHEFVLREARGEYFMWASDDDWWDERFVEKTLAPLEKNAEYGVAMCHYEKHIVHDGEPRTEIIKHDFTNLSHQELYRRYLRGRITPIFFFGLYKIDLLRRVFKRKTPSCFNGLMLTLSEVALATRCYSVQEVLHRQLQDAHLYMVRHPTNPYTFGVLEPFAITRYVLKIPFWLLTSRAIPLRRKNLILIPWLARAWLYKRKIAHELWRYIKYLTPFVDSGKEHMSVLLGRYLTSVNYRELGGILLNVRHIGRKDMGGMLGAIRERKTMSQGDDIKKLEFLEAQLR